MKVHQIMIQSVSTALNNDFFIFENVLVLRYHASNSLVSEGDQAK